MLDVTRDKVHFSCFLFTDMTYYHDAQTHFSESQPDHTNYKNIIIILL